MTYITPGNKGRPQRFPRLYEGGNIPQIYHFSPPERSTRTYNPKFS